MTPEPGKKIERLSSKTVYEGPVADVRVERFRRPDGQEVERQVVAHKGAVAVVAYDQEHLYLVRQPREAVLEPALLELPAGLLDKPGEEPIEAARRELIEEIGYEAKTWCELQTIYPSPGFINERITIFEATDLVHVGAQPDGDECIEIIEVPLTQLDRVIPQIRDAKTLIGLFCLRARLGDPELRFP